MTGSAWKMSRKRQREIERLQTVLQRISRLREKLTDTGQNKGGRQYTDVPAARVSLKEKLEAFKVKAAEGDADKATPKKAKDKAEIL